MSTVIRGATVALALLAALPARAQIPACAGAPTQADMNDCVAREYKKHDAAMNDIYQQLVAKLKDPKQRAMLVDAERAWIAYRDKLCAFQSSGTAGGTIHPLIETACLDVDQCAQGGIKPPARLQGGRPVLSCVH